MTHHPHRRFNPLRGEWVLVSPHRTKRPWQGQQEESPSESRPHYDTQCYLCPGNTRANGQTNPDYQGTYVFENDFAALLPEDNPSTATIIEQSPLLQHTPASGVCRVICFSPRHDLTLADMPVEDIITVINTWADQVTELKQTYRWVQIFENKGTVMGCSNPHPHGQVWASDFLPNEAQKEDEYQLDYFKKHEQPLLLDYAKLESRLGERTVVENNDWITVVPYWALWPYETLLLPKFPVQHLSALSNDLRRSLAQLLKSLLVKYDQLFNRSFPYSMGWHGAPCQPIATEIESKTTHWQLHAHFYPPLLRSATVKKFMVGYEMLAEAQRDLTPEQAAARLRQL
ncbi:Galactose-1-phosphate uridylyltransferase [Piscirickettsia salmonis]|uniref:UDP-glucose--hexose-1-phosphate uridylyltransferase n=1 Tax=Piscirickettsia salmonis TaxID=1238 RepID=UPI0012B798EE|nr:UDP-glucose--hexose-1-phosphate uridylyltransferase [Piscirickettsia salmonis]QGP49523.1 Galactose-1-phosphate uridylyltransferase [Piscirickettsia salmonis]